MNAPIAKKEAKSLKALKTKQWKINNKEKNRLTQARYREANRDQKHKSDKKYKTENKDKINEKRRIKRAECRGEVKAYRNKNRKKLTAAPRVVQTEAQRKEKARLRSKAYYKKNRAEINKRQANYHRKKREALLVDFKVGQEMPWLQYHRKITTGIIIKTTPDKILLSGHRKNFWIQRKRLEKLILKMN